MYVRILSKWLYCSSVYCPCLPATTPSLLRDCEGRLVNWFACFASLPLCLQTLFLFIPHYIFSCHSRWSTLLLGSAVNLNPVMLWHLNAGTIVYDTANCRISLYQDWKAYSESDRQYKPFKYIADLSFYPLLLMIHYTPPYCSTHCNLLCLQYMCVISSPRVRYRQGVPGVVSLLWHVAPCQSMTVVVAAAAGVRWHFAARYPRAPMWIHSLHKSCTHLAALMQSPHRCSLPFNNSKEGEWVDLVQILSTCLYAHSCFGTGMGRVWEWLILWLISSVSEWLQAGYLVKVVWEFTAWIKVATRGMYVCMYVSTTSLNPGPT